METRRRGEIACGVGDAHNYEAQTSGAYQVIGKEAGYSKACAFACRKLASVTVSAWPRNNDTIIMQDSPGHLTNG